MISLSACSQDSPIAGWIAKLTGKVTTQPANNLVITTDNLGVCEHTSSTSPCVYAGDVLKDFRKTQAFANIDNVELTKAGEMVAVIASIRYQDNKDLYALFFTQANTPENACHACQPRIGVDVYQFHNTWKPFAKNAAVANIGSWGKLSDAILVCTHSCRMRSRSASAVVQRSTAARRRGSSD